MSKKRIETIRSIKEQQVQGIPLSPLHKTKLDSLSDPQCWNCKENLYHGGKCLTKETSIPCLYHEKVQDPMAPETRKWS